MESTFSVKYEANMEMLYEQLKHLRTVHFTLVLTCFLMALTSAIEPSSSLRAAYKDFLEVKAASGPWARLDIAEELEKDFDTKDALYKKISIEVPDNDVVGEREFVVRTYVSPVYRGNTLEGRSLQTRTREVIRPSVYATSFQKFTEGWSELRKLNYAIFVHSVGTRIAVTVDDWESFLITEAALQEFEEEPFKANLWTRLRPVPSDQWNDVFSPKLLEEYRLHEHPNEHYELREAGRPHRSLATSSIGHEVINGTYLPRFKIAVPVTVSEEPIRGVQIINEFLETDWLDADLEEAFPELHQVASSYPDVSWDTLSQVVQVQMDREEGFVEAIGLRIPAQSIGTWGCAFLNMLQLYFLLHFRAHTQGFGERRFASGFPWVGAYSDRWSRILFSLSVSLVPTATYAVAFVGTSSASKSMSTFTVSLVCCLFGLALAVLTALETRRRDSAAQD